MPLSSVVIRVSGASNSPDETLGGMKSGTESVIGKLLSFMEERGTPITQCPTISKNPLDLYRLYIYTKERGGFLEVIFT